MRWVTFEHQGKRHRLAVATSGAGVWVGYPGGAACVAPRLHGAQAHDDAGIRAPMTGKVVQVRVAAGDAVKANDLLVVLEAMKMEYRLTAPQDGRVAAVLCAAGELIDSGEILVRLG
jgi:biotin carboxyl carrier protein